MPKKRTNHDKMILSLECGHTLHLCPWTRAEHNYNRAGCKVGRTAMCAECERMSRIVSAEEKKAEKKDDDGPPELAELLKF